MAYLSIRRPLVRIAAASAVCLCVSVCIILTVAKKKKKWSDYAALTHVRAGCIVGWAGHFLFSPNQTKPNPTASLFTSPLITSTTTQHTTLNGPALRKRHTDEEFKTTLWYHMYQIFNNIYSCATPACILITPLAPPPPFPLNCYFLSCAFLPLSRFSYLLRFEKKKRISKDWSSV